MGSCPNQLWDIGPGLLTFLSQLATLTAAVAMAYIGKAAVIHLSANGGKNANAPSSNADHPTDGGGGTLGPG
jgi:hypothetical protein